MDGTEKLTGENALPVKISEFDTKSKIISMIVLVLILFTLWYMLDLVMLTFLFTFIFYHLLRVVKEKVCKRLPFPVPNALILAVSYVLMLFVLTVLGIVFAPKLVIQATELSRIFISFDINSVLESMDPRLAETLWKLDLNPYISELGTHIGTAVTSFGVFGVNFLLSFLLSFLLLLEMPKLQKFGEVLSRSRISFIYIYIINFGGNFAKTFGKVMKVQVTIAFINCILSMIMLTFLQFPQIMALGTMIFVLGLIPVAGVLISLVPLTIIGFNIGGLSKVVAILIMVAILHAFEAYILNPKLMSNKTSLPVCFVFVILLVAEHYLHVWGLLIGVPIFIFLMDLFEVDYQSAASPHRPPFWKRKKEARAAAERACDGEVPNSPNGEGAEVEKSDGDSQ